MSMSTLTGSQFNSKFEKNKFIKLTNKTEIHNGFQFKTGLNIDNLPFEPSGKCRKGGFYFCNEFDSYRWLKYSGQTMVHYRYVTIPDDAQVYDEGDKFKCDRFVLGEKNTINSDFGKPTIPEMWEDYNYCKNAFHYDMTLLKFCKNPEFQLEAVKITPLSLLYIEEPTMLMCLTGVEKSPHALHYIKRQNFGMWSKAVQCYPESLKAITEQTSELCLIAVKKNGLAIKYVRHQTPEISLCAVNQNALALEFVKEQTSELCLAAVQANWRAFEYCHIQNPEICLAAVRWEGFALKLVTKQTFGICAAAVQQASGALKYVKDKTPELSLLAEKSPNHYDPFITYDDYCD
jgi:hypothetical protein